MIAHRLLFFALPAVLLLIMQLNIPWHALLGGGGGGGGSSNSNSNSGMSAGSLEKFQEELKDGEMDEAEKKKKRKTHLVAKNCLVAFDGPSTMTSNEDIERIPDESKRMQKAVQEYHKHCRRENEWASELIQRRNMEELALMCERKRHEDKRIE